LLLYKEILLERRL